MKKTIICILSILLVTFVGCSSEEKQKENVEQVTVAVECVASNGMLIQSLTTKMNKGENYDFTEYVTDTITNADVSYQLKNVTDSLTGTAQNDVVVVAIYNKNIYSEDFPLIGEWHLDIDDSDNYYVFSCDGTGEMGCHSGTSYEMNFWINSEKTTVYIGRYGDLTEENYTITEYTYSFDENGKLILDNGEYQYVLVKVENCDAWNNNK